MTTNRYFCTAYGNRIEISEEEYERRPFFRNLNDLAYEVEVHHTLALVWFPPDRWGVMHNGEWLTDERTEEPHIIFQTVEHAVAPMMGYEIALTEEEIAALPRTCNHMVEEKFLDFGKWYLVLTCQSAPFGDRRYFAAILQKKNLQFSSLRFELNEKTGVLAFERSCAEFSFEYSVLWQGDIFACKDALLRCGDKLIFRGDPEALDPELPLGKAIEHHVTGLDFR